MIGGGVGLLYCYTRKSSWGPSSLFLSVFFFQAEDGIRDLVRSRGLGDVYKRQALNDVSFSVKLGETFGVIGPNGCGKSTLLKVLAGVLYPDDGQVKISGKIAPFLELGVGCLLYTSDAADDLRCVDLGGRRIIKKKRTKKKKKKTHTPSPSSQNL